jgi:hypothetical protein
MEMTMTVLLDPTNKYVRSVLRRAKAKGVISYSDLNSILDDKPELSCDDIEDVFALLSDMGIQVIEEEEQGTAEREQAALHNSKQAAIEKHGAVLVHAAERWGHHRLSGVGSDVGIDPYEYLIRLYRGAYRQAMSERAPRQPATRPPVRQLLRAVERVHDTTSRPFVGAYLLEAHRD